MDSRHALMAGALILGAVVWWQVGHPGYETTEQKLARVEKLQHQRDYGGGPQLYKWRDARGVLQITDKPPVGRKYQVVSIRQDQNVIPMGGSAPASTTGKPGEGEKR
jgi:hypothetical protein